MSTDSESATEAAPTTDTDGDLLHDLTAFQRDLLVTIAELNRPHGLGIKDRLEDSYEQEIHHGRLYPNLNQLVEKGLVDKGSLDQRTNYYTLTSRGEREVKLHVEWARERAGHLLGGGA